MSVIAIFFLLTFSFLRIKKDPTRSGSSNTEKYGSDVLGRQISKPPQHCRESRPRFTSISLSQLFQRARVFSHIKQSVFRKTIHTKKTASDIL